jgi:hypothetical protein
MTDEDGDKEDEIQAAQLFTLDALHAKKTVEAATNSNFS